MSIDTWRHVRREVIPGDDRIPVGAAQDGSGEVALRDVLVRALARLAPQQRRVVVLRPCWISRRRTSRRSSAGAPARSRRPTPARWNVCAAWSRAPIWRWSTRRWWTPPLCCVAAGRRCVVVRSHRARRRASRPCCWCGSCWDRCGCRVWATSPCRQRVVPGGHGHRAAAREPGARARPDRRPDGSRRGGGAAARDVRRAGLRLGRRREHRVPGRRRARQRTARDPGPGDGVGAVAIAGDLVAWQV